ncbi:SOS response-associated peptidase family protein [Halorhabdus amylolytica]|uniref:hypothetical protein n=1 Tax=Halorhabdus amylolytica TaxID=2559573 RepID=UPI0024A6AA8B|nr:hypothetical protein [Halorhabdus amylolytica]
MPVTLPPDREREWPSVDRETAVSLLEPTPPEALRVDPVSQAVNNPTNDGPGLLTPIDE